MLDKRVGVIVGQGRLTSAQGQQLLDVVPRRFYEHMEGIARRRVPRDTADWAPVALALALDAAILNRTGDRDFLGCGCPTWTVDTLLAELGPP